ncbi:type IX secretion system membrane protein PorP/SprF [Flaviaesturariibacter flavus]|uniref:Type IX secretion system membrane protein PorP/SprF n=1 Tax=Flaviaesturariibacter flavus TaxID=2502780 RepID=A0A4R1BC98_9BACT|nr:PorP/SprF family type IX secretion system membrane protein [Flaviaesturariibacter flavus]TCJ14607.1 type IX secretion system membrane protein PorP/SprF [Flaviaesturariibacter flavus]
MNSRKTITIALLLVSLTAVRGQDPSFSQFFASPLNINPALTANINSDWRAIMHFRDQWSGPVHPYISGTLSFDTKVQQQRMANTPEASNIPGIGVLLMYDQTMGGAVKSTYGTVTGSYSVRVVDGDIYKHRVNIGFGATYGRRYVDFSKLDFEEQFTGFGFDTNLPTGEAYLSNMKPYVSLSAGITYSIKSETSNLDIGVAGYHLNRPEQTFIKADKQVIPIRKVAHVNFERLLGDQVLLSTNAIYQFQGDASYFSFGGAAAYFLNDITAINAGLWYWSNNALVPYAGFAIGNYQLGISYDMTLSKLKTASPRPNTWEVCIIFRGIRTPSKLIYCPWK